MIKYQDYIGEEFSEFPIDLGRKILKLNWTMSSGMLDQYIYASDEGQMFFVQGVCQTGNMGNLIPNITEEEITHMALAIPINSRKNLVEFLSGKIPFKKALHKSSISYLLVMKPKFYFWSDGTKHPTMHKVENGIEVSRKKELELHEFEFVCGKKCPTKKLPFIYNPTNFFWKYTLGKQFSFIFIDEDEKEEILNFIKQK
jgi:hypothetical protein